MQHDPAANPHYVCVNNELLYIAIFRDNETVSYWDIIKILTILDSHHWLIR